MPNEPRRSLPTSPGGPSQAARTGNIFEIGELVGRIYEVRALLGQGGMGQVYEALDTSLDRRVAIKAAWPNLPGPRD